MEAEGTGRHLGPLRGADHSDARQDDGALRFDFSDGAVAELGCQTLATNAGNLVFVREVTGSTEF